MPLGMDKERFKFENTVVLLMKNNNIQQQRIRNVMLLSAIVLLSIISTVAIEKVQAVTSSSSVLASGNHTNNKTTSDNSNLTGSLGLIAATPFYESNVGKIIGQASQYCKWHSSDRTLYCRKWNFKGSRECYKPWNVD